MVLSTNRSGHRSFTAEMRGKVNCRLRQERAAWAVQIPQGSPRQKKLTPFRISGSRKSQESSISVSSFFLSKSNPLRWVSIWDWNHHAGQSQPTLTPVQKTVGSRNAVGIDTSILRHME